MGAGSGHGAAAWSGINTVVKCVVDATGDRRDPDKNLQRISGHMRAACVANTSDNEPRKVVVNTDGPAL